MELSEHARQNREFWDRIAQDYQSTHKEFIGRPEPRWGVWQIPEAELQILGDVAGKDVLEFGCGAAQWSILLAQRGARPVGLDNSGVEVGLPSFTAELSSAAPAVGSITFASAPADGTRIWIVSAPDYRQEIAFEDGSRWLAGPVNEANDRAALRSLALKRDTDRAVKLPVGETGITLPAGSGSTLYAAVSTLAEIAPDIETVAGRDADIETVAEIADHLRLFDRLEDRLIRQRLEQKIVVRRVKQQVEPDVRIILCAAREREARRRRPWPGSG